MLDFCTYERETLRNVEKVNISLELKIAKLSQWNIACLINVWCMNYIFSWVPKPERGFFERKLRKGHAKFDVPKLFIRYGLIL